MKRKTGILKTRMAILAMGLALGFLLVIPAGADSVPVTITISGGGATEVLTNPDGTVDGDLFSADGSLSNTSWGLDWEVAGDIDPVLSFGFSITNNTAAVQDYFVSYWMGIVPIAPTTVTGGSISGSLTDGTGDAATLTQDSNGAPLYTALIDGAIYQTLVNAPFSYGAGMFGSSIVPGASFGNPIPSQPGPAALVGIGVDVAFSLTPGDTATFNGAFVVEEPVVPEPASLSLLGLGCAGLILGRIRARKQR